MENKQTLTFTFDLEDHMPHRKEEKRYPFIMEKILAFLTEKKINGTFFVVGSLAERHPELIKHISQQGHEIAYHSFNHKQLNTETQESFHQDLETGKALLEDITGQAVLGYRAPVFSLTKNTAWALDILKQTGFIYSSSIIPAKNPLHGFPGTPSQPFFWKNGLLEIPVPVAKLGPLTIPFMGGFYLRYMPASFIHYFIRHNKKQALWTYSHPYDFDPNEKFGRIAGASWLTSALLWFNRKNTFNKLGSLFSDKDNINIEPGFAKQLEQNKFINALKTNLY